uniref:Uncharacterized protein n=1 Tax=Eutreptiella gymnastica TaxID=73025 RepID=A0A7S1N422_9EUGL
MGASARGALPLMVSTNAYVAPAQRLGMQQSALAASAKDYLDGLDPRKEASAFDPRKAGEEDQRTFNAKMKVEETTYKTRYDTVNESLERLEEANKVLEDLHRQMHDLLKEKGVKIVPSKEEREKAEKEKEP